MGLDGKVRVVLVGDAACGKTSLAVRLSQNIFIDYHCPTDYVEDFSAEIGTRKGTRGLTILDTSSDDSVRSLAYKCCDVVVVCFDLTDSSTLENVESKWLPELEENCPGVPFILAGCKRDDMCDGPEGCVCGGACCDLNEKELIAFLSRTGASAYIDSSALTGENVEAVFGLAAECTVPKRKNSAKRLVASIKKRLSHL